MGSQPKVVYVCSQCGSEVSRWQGKCFSCGAFGSFEEKKLISSSNSRKRSVVSSENRVCPLKEISIKDQSRFSTGFLELDRVLGGGVVPGSVILFAGGPGMGKSTLLLQIASYLSLRKGERKVLYISAEESASQIKERSKRLGIDNSELFILEESRVEVISEVIQEFASQVQLVIVDSVQAINLSSQNSFTGSIAQVRESSVILSSLCKKLNLPLFLVGHVTKSGVVAGPKILEHLVDVVLFIEGEKMTQLRLLRSLKNRFGRTLEVGAFSLSEDGFHEVNEFSRHFISNHRQPQQGSIMSAVMQGSRPVLVEVQALTVPCSYDKPIRNSTGIDSRRLLMLLAVLEKNMGIKFGRKNVFVNLSGGMKINESGLDLALCLVLISSAKNKVLPRDLFAVGEVGLLGELKRVPSLQDRLNLAKETGFRKIVSPENLLNLRDLSQQDIF